ncbi:hypothetical protein M153_3340007368 [Pseudoloma neurophilia]|uniref:Uncharacterized protein n=1 Tax=Pseudoloma neurophilia TaxID=146866 RepID=A0A0R0LY54_9MICR|nr:hypothetical protein M153_3340007368 [Pseudoloma neurophilia]
MWGLIVNVIRWLGYENDITQAHITRKPWPFKYNLDEFEMEDDNMKLKSYFMTLGEMKCFNSNISITLPYIKRLFYMSRSEGIEFSKFLENDFPFYIRFYSTQGFEAKLKQNKKFDIKHDYLQSNIFKFKESKLAKTISQLSLFLSCEEFLKVMNDEISKNPLSIFKFLLYLVNMKKSPYDSDKKFELDIRMAVVHFAVYFTLKVDIRDNVISYDQIFGLFSDSLLNKMVLSKIRKKDNPAETYFYILGYPSELFVLQESKNVLVPSDDEFWDRIETVQNAIKLRNSINLTKPVTMIKIKEKTYKLRAGILQITMGDELEYYSQFPVKFSTDENDTIRVTLYKHGEKMNGPDFEESWENFSDLLYLIDE